MEFIINNPQVTTLYVPSKRVVWHVAPTTLVTIAINNAIKRVFMHNTLHPKDIPSMIELKE